jgi:hypothetical protein
MLSIHDGSRQSHQPAASPEMGKRPVEAAACLPPARRANLCVSTRSHGTNGGVSGG